MQKSVSEPQYSGDPASRVTFDIGRAGTDGIVNLRWRLEAAAVLDFNAPLTGIITFAAVSFMCQFVNV